VVVVHARRPVGSIRLKMFGGLPRSMSSSEDAC
jgi:hypothetical protein